MSAKVILLSGDGQKVEIDRELASKSALMASMLADDDDPTEVPEIPLVEVDKDTLDIIVSFLEHHRNDPMKEVEKPIKVNEIKELVSEWDANLVNSFSQERLFKVITQAGYAEVFDLRDLGITKLACMVKGRTPEEVKKIFNIEHDISPEEEKKVRDENPWIFEDIPK